MFLIFECSCVVGMFKVLGIFGAWSVVYCYGVLVCVVFVLLGMFVDILVKYVFSVLLFCDCLGSTWLFNVIMLNFLWNNSNESNTDVVGFLGALWRSYQCM